MTLIEITEKTHNVLLDLRYGTTNNFLSEKIYTKPACFMHKDTVPLLEKAIERAAQHNLKLKIFDTFRPQQAQEKMWAIFPNATYVAPPDKGSNHTRGIAIDLTLVDHMGNELDMGTPFDDFTEQAHHSTLLSSEVSSNRYLLQG